METELMQETHKFLVSKGAVPEGVWDFKRLLYKTWFKLIRRTKGDRDFDSSSFEHVFVGEARGDKIVGLHNWVQFYLQEKVGNIDYHGFFRRETIHDDDVPRLIALQFSWKDVKAKPMSSCFLGTSPEFEIAVYSIFFFLGIFERTDVQLGEYEVEIEVHRLGRDCIGTGYISAARM
ncbi:hypothetical protein ScPMuIL_006785 [Solemya velum]